MAASDLIQEDNGASKATRHPSAPASHPPHTPRQATATAPNLIYRTSLARDRPHPHRLVAPVAALDASLGNVLRRRPLALRGRRHALLAVGNAPGARNLPPRSKRDKQTNVGGWAGARYPRQPAATTHTHARTHARSHARTHHRDMHIRRGWRPGSQSFRRQIVPRPRPSQSAGPRPPSSRAAAGASRPSSVPRAAPATGRMP